jgi:glycerol-3-phosphate dehydrogenase
MKRNLERLANQKFDVLVIGGGIHGVVAAWDAVLRGLSVALIERGDFGSGTSQNSLKIIHGGLRYLQDGNITRIRTMVRERTTWMKIAPHLVHPLTCLMPTRKKLSRSRLAMGLTLTANDMLSFDRNRLADPEKKLDGGKVISQQELSNLLPGYDTSTSTGAAVWHDAQVYNTERLLLEFILSAVDAGAEVANNVEAIGFLQKENRVTGVKAKDLQSGQVFDIQSSVVINCAGAWIDNLLETATLQSDYSTSIAMNIIVDQVWSDVAAGLPSCPANGKTPQILFFVPWRNKTIIGTWHIPWKDVPAAFTMNESVIQDFIDEINSAHPPLKLSVNNVEHVTWGFLPANKQAVHRDRVNLTRDGVVIDHQKKDGVASLISVLGVKYTTARAVAEQAVDLAVGKLSLKAKHCQTHIQPVKGGQIADFDSFLNQAVADAHGIMDMQMIEHLVYTYGSEYCKLDEHNLTRIDSNLPVTGAEVIHAVREEMAWTLLDVIQRRTEIGAAGLPSMTTLQKCAALMGRELSWTMERQEQEIGSVVQAYPFKGMERLTA